MGLIALLFMGAFLFAVGLIIFGYVIFIYYILKYTKSKESRKMPIIAISFMATILLYILYNFYQTNNEMRYMRGFFGLAPNVTYNTELNTSNGILHYNEELNFNTGARGGTSIHSQFFYLKNNIKKEIKLVQYHKETGYPYYKKPQITLELLKVSKKRFKGYFNHYVDLYISPEKFTIDEFNDIANAMQQHNAELIKKINSFRRKSKADERIKFRQILYFDENTLNKIFYCNENINIHLSSYGHMELKSLDKRYQLKYGVYIGKYVNESSSILLKENISLVKEKEKYILKYNDMIINECFDDKGSNMFEELNFDVIQK